MTTINCIVTTETRTFAAHYNGGAVPTPFPARRDGRVFGWECLMRVEGSPELPAPGQPPIVRYSTNHGSYAARAGGSRIAINGISAEEAATHEQQISARFWG